MDELSKTVIIDGYECLNPFNNIVACNIDYQGEDYQIKHKTDLYSSDIYKVFGKEQKHIGKLCYNPKSQILVLHKFIKDNHTMLVSQEFGINEKIFKKLRVCDMIVFHVDNVAYSIRVSKAVKKGNYKRFKDSYNCEDLQFFIPIEELKELKGAK